MSRKYFGTDGVRGMVGEYPITPEFAMRLGYAAGKVLSARRGDGTHAAVLIGKDTRVSGYMLEAALQAGLSAAGVDVHITGPLPTPGVAYLTRALRLSAGVVISASHNPFQDNGIKFFGEGGLKLDDAVELEIEAELDKTMGCVSSEMLGRVWRVNDAAGRYIEFCKSTFPNELNLRGIKIVVDCANGAGYQVAPHVFDELGATVIAMGNMPNGMNINDKVGATAPEALRERVLREKADFGIALDGDGDRLMIVDAKGELYDGDRLLYIIAKFRHQQGQLGGGVVGTLMSNLGFEHALNKLGIPFARAKVGDRYVLELLKQEGWLLGGESSGHLLCLDKHSTGDAIVSALQVLAAILVSRQTLAEACADLPIYPQLLRNVKVRKEFDFRASLTIQAALVEAECELAGRGRVLLRPSGTEPVLRVMVEADELALTERWVSRLVEVVSEAATTMV
ncbi:phosphoglucosamine mutase [Chitinimonas sp. BJB300]|uniref:phosphoglucosamine mutase n=1 Tax=Chitinimonas sp. BJB300 TaxID=1559339 RepID=UPI000C0FA038|nr:phosphoglucosamine mutase [Chitinimonas sp. BJB300]PHV10826.1 phosphoglucosamine mutase [Chitinimonas sp. BJB300]TSJ87811.1 phosphoglucosamine mutase [Chitinimonas sp. BJB300]